MNDLDRIKKNAGMLTESVIRKEPVTEGTREDKMAQVDSIIAEAVDSFVDNVNSDSLNEAKELISYFRNQFLVEVGLSLLDEIYSGEGESPDDIEQERDGRNPHFR